MCTSPIQIKNPNYRQSGKYLSRTVDVSSQYIRVPCGHCDQCNFLRQTGLFQRIILESSDSYIYFTTLTYNNESLHHFNVDDEVFAVAKYSDFQKYIKRLRKYDLFQKRGLRYICCREYGSKKGRPHFHFLLFLRKLPDDLQFTSLEIESQLRKLLSNEWRRNIGTTRYPLYKPLYTYSQITRRGITRKNFDCHLVKPVDGSIDDALWYVLKYMCKESKIYKKMKLSLLHKYGDKTSQYYQDLNLLKPKIWKSVLFGNGPEVPDLVREMIRQSRMESAQSAMFIYKGYRYPLSRYYKDKYFTEDDVLYFTETVYKLNGRIVYDNYDPVKNSHQAYKDRKRLEGVDFSDVLDMFDED